MPTSPSRKRKGRKTVINIEQHLPIPSEGWTHEARINPGLAYRVERRLMALAKMERNGGDHRRAQKTRDILREYRRAISVLHPLSVK